MRDRLPGIKRYVVHGREFVYDRRSGIRLRASPESKDFAAELAVVRSRYPGKSGDKACTLWNAFLQLQSSEKYRQNPLHDRDGFQNVFEWLTLGEASKALTAINAAFARRVRDRAARLRGWKFANTALAALQATINFAVESGKLTENAIIHVSKIPRPRSVASRERRRIPPIRERAHGRTAMTRGNVESHDG